MATRNIAGSISDRHGIPLLHTLRLDVDALEEGGTPAGSDFVLAVIDGELVLVAVDDLPSGGSGTINDILAGPGISVDQPDLAAGDVTISADVGDIISGNTFITVSQPDLVSGDITLTFDSSGLSLGSYLRRDGTTTLTGDWAVGTQSIGLNVATPDRRLEILDAANPQLRLTHTDGTRYTDLQANNDATFGGLCLLPAANASGFFSVNIFGTNEGTGLSVFDDGATFYLRSTVARDIVINCAAGQAVSLQQNFATFIGIGAGGEAACNTPFSAATEHGTDTVQKALGVVASRTGGLPGAEFGSMIQFTLETDDGSDPGTFVTSGEWHVALTNPTTASVDTDQRFLVRDNATLKEILRVSGALPGVRIENVVGGAPAALLDVRGDAIFNEDGLSVNTRFEGDTDPNLLFLSGVSDRVGVGTDPSSKLHVFLETANVGAVLDVFRIERRTTGVAVNGIGAEMRWVVENGSGSGVTTGHWEAILDLVTAGSENSSFRIRALDNGSAKEIVRVDGSFPGVLISDNATQVPDARLHVIGTGHYTSDIELDGALNHDGTTVGLYGVAPVVRSATYTPTNVTTDRSYDANATTIDELADVLGTLISDLQATGIIG